MWLPRRNGNFRIAVVPAQRSAAGWDGLGERGLADRDEQLVTDLSGEGVVLLLKPVNCGLEVTHPLLKTAHLGDHARIWPAYVAEYCLRHGKRSSTLSDQSGHECIAA
jgi:hypothetical protein